MTFHSNIGVEPPLVGVALKVTDTPWQDGFVSVAMDTPAGRLGLTIIVIRFEVAGFPVGQRILDVR